MNANGATDCGMQHINLELSCSDVEHAVAESRSDQPVRMLPIHRLMEADALRAPTSAAACIYAAERFSFAEGRARMKAASQAVDLFGAV